MDHGRISREVGLGLRVLRERIESASIPPKQLDRTLNIATWNIREFGRRRRSAKAIHYIAEIIHRFDIVSVVELRDNVTDLRRVMKILGQHWKVVFSDYNADRAGNRERVAYVYDGRSVEFTGLAAEASPPRKKVKVSDDPLTYDYRSTIEWWRSPFLASFRSGAFDFVLLSAHIRWGDGAAARVGPITELAKWVKKRRRENFVTDKDIIVMGDFNIPSRAHATFAAITAHGLQVPPALLAQDFGTNLAQNKRYDQILHYPLHDSLYKDEHGQYNTAGGVLDFYAGDHGALFEGMTKTDFTYQMSDHLRSGFRSMSGITTSSSTNC